MMHSTSRRVAALCACAWLAGCAAPRSPSPSPVADPGPEVARRSAELLHAYGHKDNARLRAMLDPDRVAFYGADSAEVATTLQGVMQRIRDDQALWDSLVAGPMRNLRVEGDGRFAVAMFDVGTEVYRGPGLAHYLVRFAMTWRRGADGEWRLVQSMNSVPTTGQSAAEIIRAQSAPPR
jgi:ketosteroid isomerase-like protein